MSRELPPQSKSACTGASTSMSREYQQLDQDVTPWQLTDDSAPSHVPQGEPETPSTHVGGSPDVSSPHSESLQTTSSAASRSSSHHRRGYLHRNYWAGKGYQQRNVSGRGSISHGGRSSHRAGQTHSQGGHRAGRSLRGNGGRGGRQESRDEDEFLDSYDGYDNFMVSFGLKPWEWNDIEMGENIIEECASHHG